MTGYPCNDVSYSGIKFQHIEFKWVFRIFARWMKSITKMISLLFPCADSLLLSNVIHRAYL